MSTTSHERLLGRRGWLLLGTLILGVSLAAFGVVWWKHRPAIPEPPTVNLSGDDPAVVEAIESAQQQVRQTSRSAAAWGKLGIVLLAHGFRSQARTCFAQAEQLDPHDPHWPYYQGYILTLDKPGAAIAKLQQAADLIGDQPTAPRLRLGIALLGLGRTEEAEAQFRRVLNREPDNPQAHLQLARVLLDQGDLKECLLHLGHALDAPSTRKAAHSLAAEVHQRLHETAAADQERRLAQDLPEDSSLPDPFMDEIEDSKRGMQARLLRAEDLLAAGRVPEGVTWLRELVRDYPDSSWAWLRLGKALVQTGDLAGAEQALHTALEQDPNQVGAHFYLGVVFFQRGDYQGAAKAFRRATALKPDFALAYYNLGLCCLRQGDLDGARDAFRAAIENKPHYTEAHAELAAVLARQGRKAEALEQARAALQLDPANSKAQDVIKHLETSP
ncbi:MAG: tetratricopeptide repeat protein [Planctomycetes bacterium]|nr:tetratricopeptide repeat protein [Planctomycetota bacterium]